MDSFNKVISFVLGLVVVLVFFAVVTGKINLKSKTSSTTASSSTGFFNFKKTTPTPTPTSTLKPSPVTINTNTSTGVNNVYKTSTAKSIPSTGLPTIFVPLLFSGLVGGSLLRKAGKK
ncbi:MAG: hypothetical protein AAB876_00455 [Patescibacteria group bacterium]